MRDEDGHPRLELAVGVIGGRPEGAERAFNAALDEGGEVVELFEAGVDVDSLVAGRLSPQRRLRSWME